MGNPVWKKKEKKDQKQLQNNKINQKRKEERIWIRRDITFTAYLFLVLFIAMLAYVFYYIHTHQFDMINSSYNSAQEILMSQNTRGTIYASGGEILAEDDSDGEREYPYSNVFAHVVGYASEGMSGIESLANYYLIQSDVSVAEQIANKEAGEKNPGDNVYTTLNVDLQQVAYDALGDNQGAVVVTDPRTGEVLAMVSKPDFDPNEISDIWDDLVSNSDSSELLNRCTQGLYPPGSTFKIITALEYIRENPDTYQDYEYDCTGSITIDGVSIQCYHGEKHGLVDLTESFAQSCNSSFANIASQLDWDAFGETAKQLLFGESLPFSLDTSISSVQTGASMTTEDKMQTGIGQGETVMTPLHLNMITCAVANSGVLEEPYLLDKVVSPNGDTLETFSSGGSVSMMSEDEADILKGFMTEVVEDGTASKLSGLSYTAAGKTGSAEYDDENDSHAWFTGFAPADDPEICVTVIVEGAGTGGEEAVPIAKDIFDTYFGES